MARKSAHSSNQGRSLRRHTNAPASSAREAQATTPPEVDSHLDTIQARLASTMRRLSSAFVAASPPPPVRDVDVARRLAERTRHFMLLHTTVAVTAQASVQPAHALALLDEPGSAREERLELQERLTRPTDEARPAMRPVSRNTT